MPTLQEGVEVLKEHLTVLKLLQASQLQLDLQQVEVMTIGFDKKAILFFNSDSSESNFVGFYRICSVN